MLLKIGLHRYNEELTQVFMSCNLMGGMFQRLGKGILLLKKFIIFQYSCIGSSVARPNSFNILRLDPVSSSRLWMTIFSVNRKINENL
jgi:hypothetical protein